MALTRTHRVYQLPDDEGVLYSDDRLVILNKFDGIRAAIRPGAGGVRELFLRTEKKSMLKRFLISGTQFFVYKLQALH